MSAEDMNMWWLTAGLRTFSIVHIVIALAGEYMESLEAEKLKSFLLPMQLCYWTDPLESVKLKTIFLKLF